MSQSNSSDKTAMLAKLDSIHKVEGFDPSPFAVDYTDLNTQETRKRLPVMIQMAWFRLKYPEGRIAIQVSPGKDCFVATARIYPSYKDPVDCYLAEATASRGPDASKPSVSPREWAQTAAVGIALRNAGFGLQFAAAGDDFADIASDELTIGETDTRQVPQPAKEPEYEPVALTAEQKLEQAFQKPCPIKKYSGKTLGEVLAMDPNAIAWVANKYKDNQELSDAARLICEHAIDTSGKERFRIPDGDSIRVTRPDGSHSDHTCRYIDEHRAEIGYGVDNLYHMAQFAEWMARNGNTYVPLRSSLPKQCYSLLLDTGNVVILKRGETGYYKTDIPHTSKEEARALVEEYNHKLGVTRAQEEAMKGGSMFGFDKPIADPANYDAQGQPLKHREKDRGDAR